MIQHEEVEATEQLRFGTVLHQIKVKPEYAPEVTLYVFQRAGFKTCYVVRDPHRFVPQTTSRMGYGNHHRGNSTNFLSKHSREDLALAAALRRARRYEAAYSVDRSRGHFRKGGET